MAVKDDNVYHPTEALILHKPRRHYRTNVHPLHWQLRSQIGVENKDTIYYPGGNGNLHVQRLNTTTRESETVKLLSFSPRCLVAKNGWVCCGGETGEFAAIPLHDESVDSNEAGWGADSESAPLTLGLEPSATNTIPNAESSRRDDAILSILSRSHASRSIVAKSKSFGKERVNCITLWFPERSILPFEGGYSQPVAVLANNDKHVIIVNLQDMECLDELSYPDCVNRAVLSPDGRLLVAISDDPYLYVHEKVEKLTGTANHFRNPDRPHYEWRILRTLHLKSQRKEDKSDNRGSFAACFSDTGRYLAVGTQYGMISVFDTQAMLQTTTDPLITSFASSRPNSEPGAVRDMAFSPGPLDLLAWTEDRGRVGIADVRSNFVSRQILKLGAHDAFDHIIITDRGSIDPRLLERSSETQRLLSDAAVDPLAPLRPHAERSNQRGDALASNLANTLDLSLSSENRRNARRPNLDRYHYPLSSDETIVLEALQEHRRRREQRAEQRAAGLNTSSPLRGGGHGSNLDVDGPPPFVPNQGTMAGSRTRERSASVSRAVSDILGNIRDQRERLRETQERLRAYTRNVEDADRRRLTTITATAPSEEPDQRRLRTSMPPSLRNRTTVEPPEDMQRAIERQNQAWGGSAATRNTASGGWADLEVLYNLSFDGSGRGHNTEEPTSGTRPRDRERDRAAFFGSLLSGVPLRDWEEAPRRRDQIPNTYFTRVESPPEPDETAGLAWSEDGRTLFVGAENGIYEFHVNVVGRKFFPSMALR